LADTHQNIIWHKTLKQGYSNGGPQSESRPLDGDSRTLSAFQMCILYPEIVIPKFCTFGRTSKALTPCQLCKWLSIKLLYLSWATYA